MYPRRTNMVDGGSQKSQKSDYQKSKIPVLSRGYKRVLKDVKAKREKIEKLEAEFEVTESRNIMEDRGIQVSRATKTATASRI